MNEAGLHYLSVDLYERVLKLTDKLPDTTSKTNDILHLTCESAHNLILIYKKSGNKHLAIDIMRKYLLF